jgi:hypothetical protein
MHAQADADGGDRLFMSLLRAAERSTSAVGERLARLPAVVAEPGADAEVRRPIQRAD